MKSHDSHNAPSARYRMPAVHSDQRKASADKTSLNPADAWPFARIAPQSEAEQQREFLNTAPEALL